MKTRARKNLADVIMIFNTFGAIASIFGLSPPMLYWVAGALAATVAVAGGYRLGLAQTPTIEVFPHRPPGTLETELGDAEEVWFSWHSGTVKVAEGDLWKRARKISMVLTDPQSQALHELAKIANIKADLMATGIRALTVAVKKGGGSVWWFDGPVANSIVIADPDKPCGWARIEVLLPFGAPASRPSIRVRASSDPDLFAGVKDAFTKLRDKSTLQQ